MKRSCQNCAFCDHRCRYPCDSCLKLAGDLEDRFASHWTPKGCLRVSFEESKMENKVVLRCVKDCELSIWDGRRQKMAVKAGEELPVTYHEFNGCLGLIKDGHELHCSPDEREAWFEEV